MCFMQHDVLARAITWGGGGPKQISDVICMITIDIMSGINGQCNFLYNFHCFYK